MDDQHTQEPVAVVMVSGVGNESPGSGRAVVVRTLLGDPTRRWRSATESTIHLHTRADGGTSPQATTVTNLVTGDGAPQHRETFPVQIADVESDGSVPPVRVFEMYWADLSRAQGAISRVFYLLMAITLQLSTIGLEAVRTWSNAHNRPRDARLLHRLMNIVSYFLVTVITPITLTMVTLLAALNAQLLLPRPDGHITAFNMAALWVVAALGALAAAWIAGRIVAGGWTFQRPASADSGSLHGPVGGLLSVAALGCAVWAAVDERHSELAGPLAVALAVAAIAVLLDLSQDRTGAKAYAARRWILRVAFAAGPITAAAWASSGVGAARTADVLAMVSLRLDRLAWMAVLAMCFGVAVLAARLRWGGPDEERDERRRLSMSAIVTMVIGPLLFAAATTVIFVFVSFLARVTNLFPASWPDDVAARLPAGGIFGALHGSAQDGPAPREWGDEMIRLMVQPLGLALMVAGLLVLALLWFAGRYVASLLGKKSGGASAAERQGRAFDRLLDRAGSSGSFVAIAFVWCGAALAAAVIFWLVPSWSDWLSGRPSQVIDFAGYWVMLALAAVAAGAVGMREIGLLRPVGAGVAKVMTAALDLAYDIASYLRIGQPGIVAPRVQMLARYRALLAHLTDAGYARVVVVAHSQGTQLTYAALVGDSDRQPPVAPPVHVPGHIELITFGSPLRQSYRRRLPGQFTQMVPPLDPQSHVVRHTNIYRSGDYIGRTLGPPTNQVYVPRDRSGMAFDEFCIGTGHHTGYPGDPNWKRQVRTLIAEPPPQG